MYLNNELPTISYKYTVWRSTGTPPGGLLVHHVGGLLVHHVGGLLVHHVEVYWWRSEEVGTGHVSCPRNCQAHRKLMVIFQLHSAKGFGSSVTFMARSSRIRSKFALSTEGGGAEPVVMAELQQTPTGHPKRRYLRGRCSL